MHKNLLWKKGLVIGIIFLFIGMSFVPSTATKVVVKEISTRSLDGNILYVGGSEPGNYTKIQGAIDNASDEDTVFVYDDSAPYYENVIVNKTIDLIGEDRNTTIIDGNGSGDVVYISADWVNIRGFTIKRGENGGIRLDSSSNTITGNNFSNNYYGIALSLSHSNTITGNNFSNNEYGIFIESSNSINITGNNILSNWDGIVIEDSHNNIIMGNNISVNNWMGIDIAGSNNTITGNNICSNNYCSMAIGGYNNTIAGNNISNNEDGIMLWYSSSSNTITGNNIMDNEDGISLDWNCNNNIIYHNNLINNTQNAYDEGSNTWHNGYPSGGNYWDDYNGTDDNGDGLGDIPYNITGGDNQDSYPFMCPNGWDNEPPYEKNISGPGYGRPYVRYTFYVEVHDSEGHSVYCMWDWGDGSYSDWLGPYNSGDTIHSSHTWSIGVYYIRLKAKDIHGAESDWSEPLELHIEDDAPQVKITKPVKALYIMNRKILPRFFRRTLILGTIDITVDAIDDYGIEKVEFYIDNKLKSIDNSSPYAYKWSRDRLRFIHLHVIKVVAYDNAGNIASDKIIVRKLF